PSNTPPTAIAPTHESPDPQSPPAAPNGAANTEAAPASHSADKNGVGPSATATSSGSLPPPYPVDAVGVPAAPPPAEAHNTNSNEAPQSVRYVVDSVVVTGNTRTRDSVIARFVPFTSGDILDVDDRRLELTKFRLLGTGFFRDATLSLRKGKAPGHVTLVVDVVERNTVVVNDVWMGLAASADTRGEQSDISSFAGIDAAETNVLSTSITVGVAAAFSADQESIALRYNDPAFLSEPWLLHS